mgnify:FL=1
MCNKLNSPLKQLRIINRNEMIRIFVVVGVELVICDISKTGGKPLTETRAPQSTVAKNMWCIVYYIENFSQL